MLKIMKKLSISLLAFVLLLGVSFSFAGNSSENPPKTVNFSGKVIDKSSEEALAGALVIIEGTDMETYTDFEGNFSFKSKIYERNVSKLIFLQVVSRDTCATSLHPKETNILPGA